MKIDFDKIIQNLQNGGIDPIRKPISFSWGDRDSCRALFETIFVKVDTTIKDVEIRLKNGSNEQRKGFVFLPEYEAIVDWMVNTEGKGLCLWGKCGRGKSTIIASVVPMLFKLMGKDIRSIHALHLHDICKKTFGSDTHPDKTTNLDYLLYMRYPIIDEVGVEEVVNDYGTKIDGVSQVILDAEESIKPLFISTNLDHAAIVEKYDIRILDRIGRLCNMIEFKGPSLR